MDSLKESSLLKRLSVLLVEDDPSIRKFLEPILRRRVKTLYVAFDGEEGLRSFKSHNPDIVITDIRMPKMDGIKMAEEIKKINPNTPIIILTAHSESDYLIKAIEIGIDKYLLKPIDIQDLLKALIQISSRLLEEREREAKNRFIQYLLDLNPTFLLVSDGKEVEYINQSFLAFLGYSSFEEFKKEHRCIGELITFIDDKDYESQTKSWIELLEEDLHRNYIITLKRKNTNFYFLVKGTKIFDKYFFSFVDISDWEKELKEFKQMAFMDNLTGVYNRRYFENLLKLEMEKANRYNLPFSLLLFDIDHFKKINDTFGHAIGDEVLKTLCEIVSENLRKSDCLARWGGEEFVILTSYTPLEEAFSLAERLRSSIESYPFPKVGKVTCSFGVAEFKKGLSPQEFFERADQALYQAKRTGRNRTCVYKETLGGEDKNEEALERPFSNP